jgi:hypothetical protein
MACDIYTYFWNEWVNVKLKPVILWDCCNNGISTSLLPYTYTKNPRHRSNDLKNTLGKWEDNFLITIDFILANKHMQWDWNDVSWRYDLRMKHIIDNPDIPWNLFAISRVQDLSIDYVIANIHKNWNWEFIQLNANFTMLDIQKLALEVTKHNNGNTLNYFHVCDNPNLTTDFVLEHKECSLNWNAIRKHEFKTERIDYICAKCCVLCLHIILDNYEENPRAYCELAITNGLRIVINAYLVKMIAKYVNP